jgi:hypothetical protein
VGKPELNTDLEFISKASDTVRRHRHQESLKKIDNSPRLGI